MSDEVQIPVPPAAANPPARDKSDDSKAAAPAGAGLTQPGSTDKPAVKDLAPDDVVQNVGTYVLLIAAYLVPLLLLSYILAAQAEWFAVRRLPELAACVSFDKMRVEHEGHEWLKFWNKPTFPVLEGAIQFTPEAKATELEQKRINAQHQELLQRIRHHGSGLSKLFGIYTSSIIMTGITSAAAAILLLFITSSGWTNAHNYAKAIFLVALATSGYYIAFPKIFLLDDNMTANREHYLAYIGLANELCTYAATGQGYVLSQPSTTNSPVATSSESRKSTSDQKDKNNQPTPSSAEIKMERHGDPADFIVYMDYELNHWNAVAVGFDASKNPDFRKLFDEWLKSK
jgi:hypothetical protein